MTITVTAPGAFITTSKSEPEAGRSYALEDAESGTGAQNRAFHALVQVYWTSGAHSYQAKSYDDFRNCIKRSLGAGFEAFVYAEIVDGRPVIKDAPTYADIPAAVRANPDLKQLVRGRLKSWTAYTKRERKDTMDKLITEMREAGVNSRKFCEIIEGMEGAFK